MGGIFVHNIDASLDVLSSCEDDDVRERIISSDQGGHGGPEGARAEDADLLHHVSKDDVGGYVLATFSPKTQITSLFK